MLQCSLWSSHLVKKIQTTPPAPTPKSFVDPFDGPQLNTGFWQIFDNTLTHEQGLNLTINGTLNILRGPNNDNNGFYGVESTLEYPSFKMAKIDFWLAPEHGWQNHKVGFVTPYGAMGYYNVDQSWWIQFTKSNGDLFTYNFNSNAYTGNQKYSFRITYNSNSVKFEWDNGSGYQLAYETSDFKSFFWSNTTYKKVNIIQSDKGTLKCDNFELTY